MTPAVPLCVGGSTMADADKSEKRADESAKKARKPREEKPADFPAYWQMRMEGATLRLRAAQQIVSHPTTRGDLAENLVRELIREFLPQRWAVGTGFIMEPVATAPGKITANRSNQIDVLIYDQFESAPVFKDGELVILSPGSAKVAVEVKSTLNKTYVLDSYDNICSAKAVDFGITGLIFGYDGIGHESFANNVKEWAGSAGKPGRDYWPDQVFNMGQEFLCWRDPEFKGERKDRPFTVHAQDDPIVRMFLTAALNAIGISNLSAFFGEEKAGAKLHTI
jgi:hypothetical protein